MAEKMTFDNAYALIIGVGYDLPVTVQDAKAIGAALTDPKIGGYDPQKVTILTEENARRDNVVKALEDLITNSEQHPEATILIYYSGHGEKFEEEGADEVNYFLKLYEFDDHDREGTMLAGSEFAELVNKVNSQKLLVLFDCCHASGMDNHQSFLKSKQAKSARSDSSVTMARNFKGGSGRVFIASCDDSEKSLIPKGAPNSLFTTVLIESFHGINSKEYQYVHVIELIAYLMRKVPAEASKLGDGNRKQSPVLSEVDHLNSEFFVCANPTYGTNKPVQIGDKSVPKPPSIPTLDEMWQMVLEEGKSVKFSGNILNYGNNVKIVEIDDVEGDVNV